VGLGVSARADDVRDLSRLVRVDLRAVSATVKGRDDIGLVVTLTNLTHDPVAVVPSGIFRYINFDFAPRCGGFGGASSGTSIGDSVGSEVTAAVLLKPGKSISRNGALKQPDSPACLTGGSWVITVDYCQFESGRLDQHSLLEGCSSSNPVIVEVK
jgi:hypothetical protein